MTKKYGTGVFLRNLKKTIEANWGVFGCISVVFGVYLGCNGWSRMKMVLKSDFGPLVQKLQRPEMDRFSQNLSGGGKNIEDILSQMK